MSNYTMYYTDNDGNPQSFNLTGEETITTTCPDCGGTVKISFEEFADIMADNFDLYGDAICCDACTAERRSSDRRNKAWN